MKAPRKDVRATAREALTYAAQNRIHPEASLVMYVGGAPGLVVSFAESRKDQEPADRFDRLLLAVQLRASDKEWVDEMIGWLDEEEKKMLGSRH